MRHFNSREFSRVFPQTDPAKSAGDSQQLLQLSGLPHRVEHPARSSLAEFGRTSQSELFFDVHLVGLDRLHTQVQLSGEARRTEAASDQRKNLQFAIA